MSIEVANDQIKKFLGSSDSEVIVIKGKWGTGKTFLWDKILREAKETNKIALTHYSYISAFGLDSITSLRNKIFENQIPLELIGKPVNFETFINNINNTFSHLIKKASKSILKVVSEAINTKIFGSKDTLPLSNAMLYMSITKTIVCIDDLERKGNKITHGEILGLVSDLKYQKKCKVALIFNDAAFSEEDKKLYEELREKVVDKEIYFNPMSKECGEIVFTNIASDSIKKDIPDLCNKLGISNIRILFIVNKLADSLLSLLQGYPQEIIYQALSSLILFCYCYYSKDESFPSFEQLRSITYTQTYSSKDDNAKQEKWVSILQEYGYVNTDEFDLIIYDGVKNGYFNESELYIQANIIRSRLEKDKSQNSYHNAWDLFHDSFQDNKNEVVDAINDAFNKNHQYLSLNDLNSAVSIFRSLDQSTKADALIDLYLESKKSDGDYLARAYSKGMFGQKIDPALKQKLEEVFNSVKDEKTLHDIFLSMADRNSWSDKEQRVIEQASADELHHLLKETSGSDLRKIIKFGFMLNNVKMREAVLRIREENILNKLRTDKYFQNE